jgi:TolA-binding protein
MSAKVKALLQKINFVETDMEMQKHILFSIPTDNKIEIEKLIDKIAGLKKQIADLRQEIKNIDENEYNKIIAIEKGTKRFQELSRDKKFVHVNTLNESGECFITLNDGTRMDCLVAAKEENGNFTILTLEGEAREFPKGIVKQEDNNLV